MTTINKTVDTTKEVLTLISTEAATKAWMWLGSRTSRVSTGTDRAPGEYPIIKTKVPVYYVTKPWFIKGKRVRDRETKTRYKWVFRRNPRASFEVDHPYTATHTRFTNEAGLCVKRLGVWYYLGTPKNWDLTTPTDPWSANDEIALAGKLREAIVGSSFNAGVAAAESKRTLKMLTDNATKIYSAFKAVKRGNPMHALNILTGKNELSQRKGQKKTFIATKDAAAANWLEMQYGWMPLLSDMFEGAVFLDTVMNKPTVFRVKVTKFAGGQLVHKKQLTLSSSYATLPIDVVSSTRLVAKLTAVNHERLSGLQDPTSVAWELVPFSFVVDWALPIGNFLSAQELARSLTGVFVKTHYFQYSADRRRATTNWQLSTLNDGRKIHIERTVITRTVSTSLSIPLPEVKPLSKVASWTHAANALALLTNANGRR